MLTLECIPLAYTRNSLAEIFTDCNLLEQNFILTDRLILQLDHMCGEVLLISVLLNVISLINESCTSSVFILNQPNFILHL